VRRARAFPGPIGTHAFQVRASRFSLEKFISTFDSLGLSAELTRAVAAPDMRERLASAALEPAPNTPEQFKKLIVGELQRWKNVMKDAGIKPE